MPWVRNDAGVHCLNTRTFRRCLALSSVFLFNHWISYRLGILSDVVKKYLDPLFTEHSKHDCDQWNCVMSLHLDLQTVDIKHSLSVPSR